MIFRIVIVISTLISHVKTTHAYDDDNRDTLYFNFFDDGYPYQNRRNWDTDEDPMYLSSEIESDFPVHLQPLSLSATGHASSKDELAFSNIERLFSSSGNREADATVDKFESDQQSNYIYSSEVAHPNNYASSSGYRPYFLTQTHHYSTAGQMTGAITKPFPVATIQKIDRPRKGKTSSTSTSTTATPNRYQEISLVSKKDSDSRRRIQNMLKKYLASFLIGRYGPRKSANSSQSAVKDWKHHEDPESKFLFIDTLLDLKNKTITKIKQFFNIFTVVKFNNTECNSTNWAGTWQGVCLTSAECTQASGMALGNCASGYGVCCVFRGSCGDSSSRNCTYFKSPNYPDYYPGNGGVVPPTTTEVPNAVTPDPRKTWWYHHQDQRRFRQISSSDSTSCVYLVYKTNSDVHQFRIDFIDLDLAGPTNGSCVAEMLVISGQNSNDQIPVLCGYNTGQHVYIDVSELTGPLQIMILSTTGARKRFKIRICQYTDTCLTSQSNCLQYYTGVTGVIQSFNYDQAAMFNRSVPGYFNNLNYAICIRREAGYCSMTFTNSGSGGEVYPFQFVNTLPSGQLTVPVGQAGVDVLNCPDDYLIIDGTRLCGDRFNDGSTVTDFTMNAPVTDASAGPIVVTVRTNGNVTGLGFKLTYTQNPCPDTS